MLFTLILAAVAGFLTPKIQPRLIDLALKVLDETQLPKGGGLDVASFAIVMMTTAVLLTLLGGSNSPLLLLIGGFAGYFQEEIRDAVLNRKA
ncbi:MAG: hypothetical protein MK160_12565 [Rhodobacteraceae bacterium]|nr:hypothetical protein [Paracoccaceae bacterium]